MPVDAHLVTPLVPTGKTRPSACPAPHSLRQTLTRLRWFIRFSPPRLTLLGRGNRQRGYHSAQGQRPGLPGADGGAGGDG